jgi:large subunit ribosomal protein L31e
MAKTETKTNIVEREYVIPLRKEWNKVPRYRRAEKAIKAIREFLVRHMKVYDKDLTKIRIDKYVNEEIWHRGIKKPASKIKIKAIKEGDIVRVELVDYSEKAKFKKAREEKTEKEGAEKAKKKKETTPEKPEEVKTQEEEKKEEETQEKKAAVVEAGQKSSEQQHKKMKHETNAAGKMTRQKHQVRKALAK